MPRFFELCAYESTNIKYHRTVIVCGMLFSMAIFFSCLTVAGVFALEHYLLNDWGFQDWHRFRMFFLGTTLAFIYQSFGLWVIVKDVVYLTVIYESIMIVLHVYTAVAFFVPELPTVEFFTVGGMLYWTKSILYLGWSILVLTYSWKLKMLNTFRAIERRNNLRVQYVVRLAEDDEEQEEQIRHV